MKILYDCFSCSPYYGSDEGIGWMWPYLMRKYHEVWVLVRRDRKTDIERYCQKNHIDDIHFVYCDIPEQINFYYKRLKQGKNGTLDFLIYQYLWQFPAYKIAKELHKKIQFDLVHHASTNDFRLLGFMYKLGIPYIIGPIGGAQETADALSFYIRNHRCSEKIRSIIDQLAIYIPGYKKALNCANKIFFSNIETMNYLLPYIKDPNKCEIMTEVGFLEEEKLAVQHKTEVKEETVFMWAGRMEYRKGLELLVDALKKLPIEKKWKVVLCGDGSERSFIQKLCDKEKFFDRVYFTGKLSYEQVQKLYEEASVFVFPSLRETTGTVIIEAMAHKLPVICLEQGGGAVIVNRDTGFLIPINDKEECVRRFAEAMLFCVDNPEKLVIMGECARNRVLENYSWQKKCDNVEKIYRDIV